MRFDALGRVARDARGAAVATVDGSKWVYQRETPTGQWEMVRRDGPVVSILDHAGANFWASGIDQWMARLDGHTPLLRGSHTWAPSDGRVGDADGPWAVTFDSEALVGTPYWNGEPGTPFTRSRPFGSVRVKHGYAAWVEFPGPRVRLVRLSDSMSVPVAQRGDAAYTPVPFVVNDRLWVMYQTDADGGVCHPADDTSRGFTFGDPAAIYDPDVIVTTMGFTLGWASDPGQFTIHTKLCRTEDAQPFPAPPPVVAPPPMPVPMRLQTFPGGWYADALPNGAYVVLRSDGSLDTDRGPIASTPAHAPLFPRLNRDGSRFSGQGWETDKTIEYVYEHGAWRCIEHSQTACGVNATIYDANDALVISDCAYPGPGSQGYRYLDPVTGRIFFGDETYGPKPHVPRLYEWTDLGDGLFVGQGDAGGVLLWDGAAHRVIAPAVGLCRFIRAHRDGDRVSIAWWGYNGAITTCLWATVDELRQLPVETVSGPTAPVRLDRPIWWMPYHVTRHDVSTDCDFHAEILTDGQDPDARHHRRLMIPDWNHPKIASMRPDEVLAVFAVVDHTDWAVARQRADALRVPLMVYYDSHEPFPIHRLDEFGIRRGWDWISPMLYSHPGEHPDRFAARARELVSHACTAGTPVTLTVQMYDRNGQEADLFKLSALQRIWADLANEFEAVIGIAPFAVRRQGGVTTYGWLRAWFDAYASAAVAPQRPSLPPREPMRLSESVYATIRDYAALYPIPHGDPGTIEDACRVWTEGLCQTVKFYHPEGLDGVGGEFGWKRASLTRPLSKESLALQVRDADGDEVLLYGWDLLTGVSTGSPTLASDPSWHDLIAEGHQVFVPVPAVDRLQMPVSDITRPDMPYLAYTSAFDLHLRHEDDQDAWCEAIWPIAAVRLVVSSIYRQGSTLDEGRAALARLLPRLKARGMKCEVTVVADTRVRGLSRAAMREHTKAVNDVLLGCPEPVALVVLFNENSHGVEADYALDPQFLKELDALIDARFPVAWGANHGGEPVSALLAGGSVIVYHSDRRLSPETNAAIMEDAQHRFGKPVVDQEPIGIGEVAIDGKRVADVDWAARQATASATLGGTCLHLDAGLSADADALGSTQLAAIDAFATALNLEPPVTQTDIALLFAGAFFEDISDFLDLTGSVAARRPTVHAWVEDMCAIIDNTYLDVFNRPCDLEGYGSALVLFLAGMSEDDFRDAKQRAYDAGER